MRDLEFEPSSVYVGLLFYQGRFFHRTVRLFLKLQLNPFIARLITAAAPWTLATAGCVVRFCPSPPVAIPNIWIRTKHLLPSRILSWLGPCPLPSGLRLSRWKSTWRETPQGSAAACAVSGSPWPTTFWASLSLWRGCLEASSSTTCSSTRGPLSSSSAWSGGCCFTPGTSTCLPRSWRTMLDCWSWRSADWAGWWGTCQSVSPAGSGSLSEGMALLLERPPWDTTTLQTPMSRWCSPLWRPQLKTQLLQLGEVNQLSLEKILRPCSSTFNRSPLFSLTVNDYTASKSRLVNAHMS